jgi:hypothetical protein
MSRFEVHYKARYEAHSEATWLADLAGRLGRKTWPADLAGRLGRQTWPADFAGRLGRQTWPADLAGRLDRQTWLSDLLKLKMAKKFENQHCFI